MNIDSIYKNHYDLKKVFMKWKFKYVEWFKRTYSI